MTNQSDNLFPGENFVPADALNLDMFFTEDIQAEPIDDFSEPDDYFTQALQYDTTHGLLKERAEYGFTRSDLFSFHTYWVNLFGRMLIQRKAQISKDAVIEHVAIDKLLAGAIAMNELDLKKSLPLYVDHIKRSKAYDEFTEKWQTEVREFNYNLRMHWLDLPAIESNVLWDESLLLDITAATKNYPAYYPNEIDEGMDDIIPDPIVVPSEHQYQHETERSAQGFSQWDVAELRTFNAWMLMKSYLYFASSDSTGWPGTEDFKNPDDWSDLLIERVGITLRGELADQDQPTYENDVYIEEYRNLFANFTHILSYLWD